MKQNWELDELIEHFTILPNEMSLIENKTGETKIGFAVLFKFFQNEARFPSHKFVRRVRLDRPFNHLPQNADPGIL